MPETDLSKILKSLDPVLNIGDYVFCLLPDSFLINPKDIICLFQEKEGTTVILDKNLADKLELKYDYIASWITLNVHSSLEAIGLTAAFSEALAKHSISCNVVAAYYHDHIFVAKNDSEKAMKILKGISEI